MQGSSMSFYYSFPTNYVFGEGALDRIGAQITGLDRVLFVHGRTAVARLGIDAAVKEAAASQGVSLREVSYCDANPDDELVDKLCDEVRDFKPDLILAAGGGSVIDAAKACALLSLANDRDREEGFCDWAARNLRQAREALPIGVILTLPASGSESNGSFVIKSRATRAKKAFASQLVKPSFAICDPSVMAQLPEKQVMCAVSDVMSHLFEQLFCTKLEMDLNDYLIMGAMDHLVECRNMMVEDANRAKAYEGIMLASSFALSYLLSMGRRCDWVAHEIDHRLGDRWGVPHGQALASIMPAWIRSNRENEFYRFKLQALESGCSFCRESGESALEAISGFYRELNLESESMLKCIADNTDNLVDAFLAGGPVGSCVTVDRELILKVFDEMQRDKVPA